MKVVVVVTPGKIEIRDVPQPVPGPYEALVRIEACGLCGSTDRHIVEGRQCHHPPDRYPAILGHEGVGTVVRVGERVKKFRVGDRVTRPVAIWPGTRRDGLYSAWGGFAEYGIVRDATGDRDSPSADYNTARQHVIPPTLSLEDAVMAVSIAEVASWMEKLGDLRGKSIAIGGTGFVACVMCQCARSAGAKHIVVAGRNARKFEWATRSGATDTVPLDGNTAGAVRRITGGGADWFLDAAGHQSVFEAGLRWLRPGGSAAIYGAPEGFAYRLPLSAVGGDFSVHYLSPQDDVFFPEACRRISMGEINTSLLRTHTWRGLESLPEALAQQIAGEVLKGTVLIASPRLET